jgi:hypothetical protein
MVKRLLALLAVTTIGLSGCGGDGKRKNDTAKDTGTPTAEEIYAQVSEKRRDLETTEEKLAVTKEFLDGHPSSDATARAIDAVVYYQGENLGDMDGAIAYAEQIRGKIVDADIAKAVDRAMIPWYGQAKMKDKMLAVAERLDATGDLGFNDQSNIIESAIKSGDWALTREYCQKARPMATADAYKAEHPKGNLTPEDISEAVNDRMGMLLVMNGWARANQGEIDAALGDFAGADSIVWHSYLGTPDYDLNLRWGKTLMMKGDYQGAIDRFATDALIMRNDEALAGLKDAYVALHKSESGFDAFAAQMHRSIAKPAADFGLADYEGAAHRFSDLKGDVTLLAFWFPT